MDSESNHEQRITNHEPEPTYPDVIEYLGAKLIGWDAGISLTGAIDRDRLAAVPLFRRAVDILRNCEEIRRGNAFDEAVKAKLREPGKEFSLFRDDSGKWRFRPAHYDSHTASCSQPWSLSWTATNPFGEQPVKFRLEALMAAGSYDDANNIVLADLSNPNQFAGPPRTANGVTASLARAPDGLQQAGIFTATNSGNPPLVARNAAWASPVRRIERIRPTSAAALFSNGARLDRKFEPCVNLKGHQAIGVWIEGGGQGQIVAIRLESPRHISYGAVADRYITIDFTGRRLFTLVETESARWSDYVWNDGKWLYNVYRETIDFGTVESLSIWYNNLPKGQKAECIIGPVKALPMLACTVKNPAVAINGKIITLPVEMQWGSYLEFNAKDDCVLYGPKGEVVGKVIRPPAGGDDGAVPVLSTGGNQIRFSCDTVDGPAPRVKLTVISHGEAL